MSSTGSTGPATAWLATSKEPTPPDPVAKKKTFTVTARDYNTRKHGDRGTTLLVSELPPEFKTFLSGNDGENGKLFSLILTCRWLDEKRPTRRYAYVNRSHGRTLYVEGLPPRAGVKLVITGVEVATSCASPGLSLESRLYLSPLSQLFY